MESIDKMFPVMESIAKSDDDPGFADRLPSTSDMKMIRGAVRQLGAVKETGKVWEGESYPTVNLVVSQVLNTFFEFCIKIN